MVWKFNSIRKLHLKKNDDENYAFYDDHRRRRSDSNIFHNRGKSVAIGRENYIFKYWKIFIQSSRFIQSVCVSVFSASVFYSFIIKCKMPSRQKSETMFLMLSSFWIFQFKPWHDTKSKEEGEEDEAQKTGGICMCAKRIECHFLKFIVLQSVCRIFLCNVVFTAWEIYRLRFIYLY